MRSRVPHSVYHFDRFPWMIVVILGVVLLFPVVSHAQIDTRHWVPPLWGAGQDSGYINEHVVIISTPEVAPVPFKITDGAGYEYLNPTPPEGCDETTDPEEHCDWYTVSNEHPVFLKIGQWSGGGYAPYTGAGWLGLEHVLVGSDGLNQVNDYGLTVDAERPVYVNIRQKSASQGSSLTSKGRKSLGKEFRAGFPNNVLHSGHGVRGAFVSVMAAEEGTTEVVFDDFKPGLVMNQRDIGGGVFTPPTTMAGGAGSEVLTTDIFSVTLEKNESYVIGLRDADYLGNGGTASLDDFNGVRITSDKLVAVASGFWAGGPTNTGGQDLGMDILVPTDLAGTQYVLIKGNAPADSGLETITVVAVDDSGACGDCEGESSCGEGAATEVYLRGSSEPYCWVPEGEADDVCSLPCGGDYVQIDDEYHDGATTPTDKESLLVTSSRPVLVYQSIGGSDSLATSGMNFIPPLGVDAATYVDNIVDVGFMGATTLGVVARSGETVWVTVDGELLDPGDAEAVVGTDDWVVFKETHSESSWNDAADRAVSVKSNSAIAVSFSNVEGVRGAAGYFSGFPASADIDLDGDDQSDGEDNCPDDPNLDQLDSDSDGVGDLCDECDDDPLKALAGVCGCGVPDGDPDGDGVVCNDNCPYDANPGQEDANGTLDGDGVGDACEGDLDGDDAGDGTDGGPIEDGCPNDPEKVDPGECGCGVPEVDSDLDGVPNCQDDCVLDADKSVPGECGCGFDDVDGDLDGVLDCHDECPSDAEKIEEGACGCGVADTDTDGDDWPDCIDLCGDGHLDVGETCDDGDADDTDDCPSTCFSATCGDGFTYVGGGEACDDGNTDNTDGCLDDCRVASCGDGYLLVGGDEECDDGNVLDGDACNAECHVDTDGDGILDADEVGDEDPYTPAVDTDGDGTPDYEDEDSDGDGLSDAEEAGDEERSTPPVDTDGDGTPDFQDPDSDDDGVEDGVDGCPLVSGEGSEDGCPAEGSLSYVGGCSACSTTSRTARPALGTGLVGLLGMALIRRRRTEERPLRWG